MFAVSSLWGRSHQLSFSAKDSSYIFKTKNLEGAGKEEGGNPKKMHHHTKCQEHITLSEKNFYEQFLLFIMLLILSTGQTALAG